MDVAAAAANVVWAGASQLARRQFRAALRDPARIQRVLLERYLRRNAHTVVGRRYDFARILARPPADVFRAYQDAVPVTSYDDVESSIARVARGEAAVLTSDAVCRLVPSAGSTSAAKLIPSTRELQQEFSRAIDAWVADLYRRHPGVIGGPAYWSVTPSISFDAIARARLGQTLNESAIPIGFEEDSAYLGGVRQWLIRSMLAVPDAVRQVSDPDAFRYVTLFFLVKARALRLISVWHPSFLIRLLDSLPLYLDRIAHDLERGTLSCADAVPASARARLTAGLCADPARALALRRLKEPLPRAVWPELAVVSCWGDAAAQSHAAHLATALPGVAIQPKGLIATEAIVTIPFGGHHPLAVRSHVFEFLDSDGTARLPHELVKGAEYSPIVTTGGGLYRYSLGDRVTVDGWAGGTPSLRFAGRGDRVSDRFGEKLSDGFVASALASILPADATPRFAMLAPELTPRGMAYTLMLEPSGRVPSNLAAALEHALRRNPHYAWCVDLGQLQPARVVRVGPDADRIYVDTCVARGQRLGDVKPTSLHPDSGWESALGTEPVEPAEPLEPLEPFEPVERER